MQTCLGLLPLDQDGHLHSADAKLVTVQDGFSACSQQPGVASAWGLTEGLSRCQHGPSAGRQQPAAPLQEQSWAQDPLGGSPGLPSAAWQLPEAAPAPSQAPAHPCLMLLSFVGDQSRGLVSHSHSGCMAEPGGLPAAHLMRKPQEPSGTGRARCLLQQCSAHVHRQSDSVLHQGVRGSGMQYTTSVMQHPQQQCPTYQGQAASPCWSAPGCQWPMHATPCHLCTAAQTDSTST